MKNFLVFLGLIIGSIVGFATVPTHDLEISPMEGPKLFPAEYPACVDAIINAAPTMECDSGMEFYMDHMGRCGCLAKGQITPPDICVRAYIVCNAMAGESFSLLSQWAERGPINMGCGCFGTYEGMSLL